MTYWLNTSNTPVLLHKGDCTHVEEYPTAYPKNWTEYPTEEAARRSTLRRIRECKDCF